MSDHASAGALQISANGKPLTVTAGTTIGDLLQRLNLMPLLVFVEYNGEPLEREAFSTTLCRPGDRLEIAQMVGGG